MNTDIIDGNIITPDGLTIPDGTDQQSWSDIHKAIITCKRAAGKWLSQSRKWAADQWGVDYVMDTEVQLEMALGIEFKEKPATLNPPDKSKAIVTIEGIAQQYSMWRRKMEREIETWDTSQVKRALELIEPIEAQARALRERLGRGEV